MASSSQSAIEGDRPPEFGAAGLWGALERLDRMLDRAAQSVSGSRGPEATADSYRGLYISGEDVERLLRQAPGEPFLAGQDGSMPAASRFPWLQREFGLEGFDVDVVLIALAPEVDLRYERLYAYLQDDVNRRRPTVDLALNLLCSTREAKIAARARFERGCPLIGGGLLHLASESSGQAPLLAQAMRLDDSVVRFLLGHRSVDSRLEGFVSLEQSGAAGPLDPALLAGLASAGLRKPGPWPRLYFEGPASEQKTAAANSLARRFEAPLLRARLGGAGAAVADFESNISVLLRESRLMGAVLLLEGADSLRSAERDGHLEALSRKLNETKGVVILEGGRPCDPRLRTVSIPFREPGFDARRGAWSSALGECGLTIQPGAIDELASRYRLSESQVRRAAESAVLQAALTGGRPKAADLMTAAQTQVRREPGSLARRVEPVYHWEDLVLPRDQVTQLRELCRQARLRHVVLEEWGFDRKLSLGKGLSALFSGPPGTGKTMGAEVIASDLGQDLFKIDLSQVVSKYIGETEKNLDRLFTEARAGNAILFFDECDALFGKRTTVQDAHDRYANIEIAYLLQKMDEHDGVSILATNLRQNLDAAFVRRLNFIVEFPFPDVEGRRRIWTSIWPAQVPRSKDLDLEFMASNFKLPGGAVKNIAVAASFLAAADKRRELTTGHLLWATRRELEKAGRSVPLSEYGRYGERVQAMAAATAEGEG